MDKGMIQLQLRVSCFKLVSNMLNRAIERLQPGDQVLLQSDQDWHYQMRQYQKTLEQHPLHRVCSEKETVWIIQSWRITLAY